MPPGRSSKPLKKSASSHSTKQQSIMSSFDGGGGSGGGSSSAGGATAAGTAHSSNLPPALRVRLYELFVQIEREFEAVYAENLGLQEKVDVLSERLNRQQLLQQQQQQQYQDHSTRMSSPHPSGMYLSLIHI